MRKCGSALAALCALFVLVFGAPAFAAESPRDIVAAIYKVAAGPDGKYSGDAFGDKTIRKRYFSKSFLAAVLKVEAKDRTSGDAATIDWDPVTNSQDPSVKNLAIKAEKETAAAATVAARFLQDTRPDVVYYDFIKEGGAWKLDNIRDGEGADQTNLRDVLAGKK